MKKLLLLLCPAALFTACDNKRTIEVTDEQYKRLINDSSPAMLIVADRTYPVVKGTDGHYYYQMYIATGAYTGNIRDFHLGGCPTCKRQTK